MPQTDSSVTITSLRARAVIVPVSLPLETSSGAVDRVPLVLLDLQTSAAVTGRSYLFAMNPAHLAPLLAVVEEMALMIADQPLVPFEIERLLRKRHALLGVHNLVTIGMSGIDMAIWDALSQLAGKPLAAMLGGQARPVRAYNSCGLGIMSASALQEQAPGLLERGFSAVKVRLGRERVQEDLAAERAAC